MQAKNESTNNPARSLPETATREEPAATSAPPAAAQPPRRPARRASPPANAFSPAFLEVARLLERRRRAAGAAETGSFAAGGRFAGPFVVEPVPAGQGVLWAVARPGEPVAEGGGAVAVFLERATALLAAAVLPASATASHVTVAEKAKRLGLAVHEGRVHLGHLAPSRAPSRDPSGAPSRASSRAADRVSGRSSGHPATPAAPEANLPRDLHVARHLATHPDALVLLAEALDYETLVLFGRALMRRLERAMATAIATA
jgi:hypothetical protein